MGLERRKESEARQALAFPLSGSRQHRCPAPARSPILTHGSSQLSGSSAPGSPLPCAAGDGRELPSGAAAGTGRFRPSPLKGCGGLRTPDGPAGRAVPAEGQVPPSRTPEPRRAEPGPRRGPGPDGRAGPGRASASSGTPPALGPRPAIAAGGPPRGRRRGPPGSSGAAAPPLPFSCSRCRGRPGATSCPARSFPGPARPPPVPRRAAPRGTTGLVVRAAPPATPRPPVELRAPECNAAALRACAPSWETGRGTALPFPAGR